MHDKTPRRLRRGVAIIALVFALLMLTSTILYAMFSAPALAKYGGESVVSDDGITIYDEANTADELGSAVRRGTVVNKTIVSERSYAYKFTGSSLQDVVGWLDGGVADNAKVSTSSIGTWYISTESGESFARLRNNNGLKYSNTGKWKLEADEGSGKIKWWYNQRDQPDSIEHTASARSGFYLRISDADNSDDTATAAIYYDTVDTNPRQILSATTDDTGVPEDYYITHTVQSDGDIKVTLYYSSMNKLATATVSGTQGEVEHYSRYSEIYFESSAKITDLYYPQQEVAKATYTWSASNSDIEGAYVDYLATARGDVTAKLQVYDGNDWSTKAKASSAYANGDYREQLILGEQSWATTQYSDSTSKYEKYRLKVRYVGEDARFYRIGLLYPDGSSSGVLATTKGWLSKQDAGLPLFVLLLALIIAKRRGGNYGV